MIFIFMNAIFITVFYFFFPEVSNDPLSSFRILTVSQTANIPLEEIGAIFGDTVVLKLDEAASEKMSVEHVEAQHTKIS